MLRAVSLIFIISLCLISCTKTPRTGDNLKNVRIERIQEVIRKSGFLKLPLAFNANSDISLESTYNVNFESVDTLIFDKDIYRILGFFPDTTDYYAFLFYTVGDMLYPTVMTLDKEGYKIDRQIICAAGCAGHGRVDILSCYDSVWIYSNSKIESTSKLIGTVDSEDSISQTFSICNVRTLKGLIEKKGWISIKSSDLINCDE